MSQVLPFHFLLLRRIKGEYQAQDVTVTDFRSFFAATVTNKSMIPMCPKLEHYVWYSGDCFVVD